jgi:probable HAF family extracellular repeat protein
MRAPVIASPQRTEQVKPTGETDLMKLLRLSPLAAFVVFACFTLPASAQYTVNNLGNLTGFTYPAPHDINNSGQVVGGTTNSTFTVTHPFRTAPNSPITDADDLGTLSGATSGSATSINASGQVAGSSNSHAFRADPGSLSLVDLGLRATVFGFNSSNANGINDSGQVTGAATALPGASCSTIFSSRAFRTIANGLVSTSDDLGTLPSYFPTPATVLLNCRSSTGFAINGSGQVVGNSHVGLVTSSTPDHAFLASPSSVMVDLGTLPGDLSSNALSINDAGQIVGISNATSFAFSFPQKAFLKDGNNAMQFLGTLGGTSSSANDINNVSQIVGNSTTAGDAATHAFIYQNGTMTDLNDLIPAGSGWVLQNASAINDIGQIVGTGTLNGVSAAFRLDPGGSAGVSILLSQISGSFLDLTPNVIGSLTSSLDATVASIARGSVPSAKGQLDAFVNKVQALVNSGRLDPDQAASLIAEANNISSSL